MARQLPNKLIEVRDKIMRLALEARYVWYPAPRSDNALGQLAAAWPLFTSYAVAAGVTPDLTARISAVDLVRAAVEAVGGKGGGGRPDLAQGGGPDASKAEDAIRAAEALLAG